MRYYLWTKILRNWHRYTIGAIFILAFLLRFHNSMVLGVNIDEGYRIVLGKFIAEGRDIFHDVIWPGINPGIPYLVGILFRLFGHSVELVRLVCVLVTSSICFSLYLLGKQIANLRVGLLSAFLFAVSPLSIQWSKFAMTEPYMIMFAIWSIYLFVRGMDRGRHIFFLGAGFFAALSFLFKIPGILLLGLFFIFLLFWRTEKDIFLRNRSTMIFTRGFKIILGFVLTLFFVALLFRINIAILLKHMLNFRAVSFAADYHNWQQFVNLLPGKVNTVWSYLTSRLAGWGAIFGMLYIIGFEHSSKKLLMAGFFGVYLLFLSTVRIAPEYGGGGPHYLYWIIPQMCILAGLFFDYLWQYRKNLFSKKGTISSISRVIYFVTLGFLIIATYFQFLWLDITIGFRYPYSTLNQERRVGKVIADNVNPGGRVLCLTNPIYHVYSKTEPPEACYTSGGKWLVRYEAMHGILKKGLLAEETNLVIISEVVKREFTPELWKLLREHYELVATSYTGYHRKEFIWKKIQNPEVYTKRTLKPL